MTPERGDGDWFVDPEGNLSGPGELQPDTDEFGRDDPAALERERRRREREQRRKGRGPKRAATPKGERGITGSFGRLRRKREEPATGERAAAPAPTGERAPPPPPTAERPAPPPTKGEQAVPPPPTTGEQAAPRAGRRLRRPGGGRPPRSPRAPRAGNFHRRRIAAGVAALVGILLVWFLVAFFQPFAGDGKGEGSVTVEIPEGSDAADIAKILDEQGVVTSARLFEWRLRLAGKADDIQADTYTLASGMSYGAAIDQLTSTAEPGILSVTIPEGLDRNQIAAQVLPEGVSSDEYLRLTEAAPKSFDPRRYGAGSASLEGFLFPATYELPPDETQRVPSLVDQQLQAFRDNISRVDMSYAKKKNLTIYDVLIIASMIDKEVMVGSERDDVAAVIYNRLSKGIPLGIDATTRFETQNYTEQITQAQLDADTPYNTRINAGLTPTPIGNPGLAAVKAAARPAQVNYLYFVVKPGTCGEHSFTASEAEFERLAAEYQQALQAEGGSPTDCE
ncbi:MAG TPA: endolytic transglycosylase MltG [Solirubrobacterales bacterium]|nr:endolytic transglycosylase MltG [Solirubrobacterales bacterium]